MNDAIAVTATRRQMRELVDGTIEVKLHIDPYYRSAFLRLFPDIDMPVAITPMKPEAALMRVEHESEPELEIVEAAKEPNRLAQAMVANGYFKARELWERLHHEGIYTLQAHKSHVETLPCFGDGMAGGCEGDIVMHHARGAEIKPAGPLLQPDAPTKVPHWYGVPACHKHHSWIHAKAEREDNRRLIEMAVKLMSLAAKDAVKHAIGIASLADITADSLGEFEQDIGLSLAEKMGLL